ncbi:START domain-containing protein [Algoriphagus confluentis]|uniref:START domain-containing protein n=2 Tax=Algoriphagus confluentis TaxID=1697556 RepID=A0ABQ6PSI0_9BACT|nr:START domain-containing protein [Algoriphagus confluentis]
MCLFLSLGTSLAQQKDCELRKSTGDLEVYTCKMEGSKINSIQASFQVNVPFSVLAEVLLDWENFNLWQYKIRKAELLQAISKEELIYRAELDAPWPVADRDLILHLKMAPGTKPGEYVFSTVGRPDFIPLREGFVRVPVSDGRWTIQVHGKDRLEVNHVLSVDPGGSIPAWLLNLSLAEGPFETYSNLIKYLEEME